MLLGETTSLEATLQLAGAQFLPRAWLEMNQLLRPSAGQMWGGERVGGRPLEGRRVLAFEGLFVAGIGGSDRSSTRKLYYLKPAMSCLLVWIAFYLSKGTTESKVSTIDYFGFLLS